MEEKSNANVSLYDPCSFSNCSINLDNFRECQRFINDFEKRNKQVIELFGKILKPCETLDFQGFFKNQNCAFLLSGTIFTFIIYSCNTYGIRLSHTFEVPGMSNEKTQYFNRNTQYFNRNTRYFESEILKCQVFHTLNLKYYVFRGKYLAFRKLGILSAQPVPRI